MLSGKLKNLAIVFVVSDLARSHAFYANTLGLTFEVTDFEGGYLQARLLGDVELVFLSGRLLPGPRRRSSSASPAAESMRWSRAWPPLESRS